jgi:hypothetical protein
MSRWSSGCGRLRALRPKEVVIGWHGLDYGVADGKSNDLTRGGTPSGTQSGAPRARRMRDT